MTAVLAFHTVSDGDAVAIADVLLDGELRGYDDHGVLFLANLTEWFRSGAMNPTPTPRVLHQRRAGALVDGDGGCGVIGATVAMETCLSLASDHGMAAVGLQRSGHFVAAAPYALMAARRGFIGFVTSNTPPLMAPTGGLSRSLGTNPLAYAFPNGEQDPLLLDMATSAIAGYKVRLAAKEGRHLDEGGTKATGSPWWSMCSVVSSRVRGLARPPA
jgi:LDH2 family malate/lactate/ureidoglycolate dehydrogenase